MKFLVLMFVLYFISPMNSWANYLLGAGDEIKITVYDEPDLTIQKKIDRSGIISFPFINDLMVIGQSTESVEDEIRKGLLGDYLVDPQVSVSIVKYRPFFIHGQVIKPGGYPFQEDLRLDKAIALAGGLSNRASSSNWKITRLIDGKSVTFDADISTVILPDDIIKIEQSFF